MERECKLMSVPVKEHSGILGNSLGESGHLGSETVYRKAHGFPQPPRSHDFHQQ